MCRPGLRLLSIILSLWASDISHASAEVPPPLAHEVEAACKVVQNYGAKTGGGETIASLIELNMQGWKPQSKYGIGINGWGGRAFRSVVLVTYRYVERDEVCLAWLVDQESGEIFPVLPLSERIQRMAELL